VLLVDEVLAVGDEGFTHKCLDKFGEFKRRNKTILLVTHSLGMVERFCDEAVWLDKGSVAATGRTEDVINAYLRSVDGTARIDDRGRQRAGSGEVQLEVEMLSGGVPCASVGTDDPVVIRLSWSCQLPVEELQFSFRLHSADGVVVAGDRVRAGVELLAPGSGHVDYTVARFSLLPGTYHIAADVTDRHSGHIYDGGPHLASFDVVPRESHLDSLGYFGLDGWWSVERHA
jgi:hypothetical protein